MRSWRNQHCSSSETTLWKYEKCRCQKLEAPCQSINSSIFTQGLFACTALFSTGSGTIVFIWCFQHWYSLHSIHCSLDGCKSFALSVGCFAWWQMPLDLNEFHAEGLEMLCWMLTLDLYLGAVIVVFLVTWWWWHGLHMNSAESSTLIPQVPHDRHTYSSLYLHMYVHTYICRGLFSSVLPIWCMPTAGCMPQKHAIEYIKLVQDNINDYCTGSYGC